jgi:hypothetical protein
VNTIETAELENKVEAQTPKRKRQERYPYPQRRYGIEVFRYEDVGRIFLKDGDLPVRSMTSEEKASVPQEILQTRKFHYPIGFSWDAPSYQLARGFPLTGKDPVSGEIVELHTDGKIFTIRFYEGIMGKETRIFLRMTTPEDEIRMDIDRERDHRRACERMRQTLALGLWIRYRTAEGTVYERHADEKLYRIDFVCDETGWIKDQHRVFLRMATEEDDALYDLRGTLRLTADDSAIF